MSPYRSPSSKTVERGPRWGATPWAKFWTKRPWLEKFFLWVIVVFVVIPIRFVMWLFGGLDGLGPLDF
jgi:hypothetical protein